MTDENITPPRTWEDSETHYLKALQGGWYRLVVKLQDCVTSATVEFWSARGVRFGHLPVTTGSISSPMGLGSDSTPVSVSMFDVRTYLADSMQFGLEYLCRLSEAGAYYMMPSFRGEASDSTHLCQFFHSEAEIPGTLADTQVLVEEYIRHILLRLRRECGPDIARASGSLDHFARLDDPTPFRSLTLDQAIDMLDGDPELVKTDPDLGFRGLTRAGERKIMELCGEFVWITHFDERSVPFYQANDGEGHALNGDLLFGPGEVVGAGERHVDGESVRAALRLHEVPETEYGWYVAMKDSAPMLTSGFGLGVERLLMWVTQQTDIRDFQVFVRENGVAILP
ncbi:asparagine synthetase A [Micromonospora sp. DT44]|uniref:asparagine synthetase A n=1 Tax=Micromonospora sp. DT44 TaxID=3393439 RepID=UPI003CF237DA